MIELKLACPHCGKQLRIKAKKAPRHANCPACSKEFSPRALTLPSNVPIPPVTQEPVAEPWLMEDAPPRAMEEPPVTELFPLTNASNEDELSFLDSEAQSSVVTRPTSQTRSKTFSFARVAWFLLVIFAIGLARQGFVMLTKPAPLKLAVASSVPSGKPGWQRISISTLPVSFEAPNGAYHLEQFSGMTRIGMARVTMVVVAPDDTHRFAIVWTEYDKQGNRSIMPHERLDFEQQNLEASGTKLTSVKNLTIESLPARDIAFYAAEDDTSHFQRMIALDNVVVIMGASGLGEELSEDELNDIRYCQNSVRFTKR